MTPPATPPAVKREKPGRARCTLVFTAAEVQEGEKQALQSLGSRMDLKGFRPGKAPESLVRERVSADQLFEETARRLLASALPGLLEREKIQPIIPPRVEATSRDPFTLVVTLIERPVVTIKGIEKISIPREEPKADAKDVERVIAAVLRDAGATELTDALAKEKLGTESAAAFRSAVEGTLRQQEENMEQMRRERLLLDAIKDRTTVDLADELVDEEVRGLTDELARDLERRKLPFEEWLKKEGKTTKDLEKDLRTRAGDRLKLRLGMAAVIEEKKITVSAEEMARAIDLELRQAPEGERERLRAAWGPGSDAWNEIRWRMSVGKVMEMFLKQ